MRAGLSIVQVLVAAPVIGCVRVAAPRRVVPRARDASWQLDPAGAPPATNGDLVWLALARADDASAGPWSWLDDPHVSVADGDYLLTGALSRFGTLVVTLLPTLIHGPEAIWGPGYSPGRGIDIPLDLTLVERVRTAGTAPSAATGGSGVAIQTSSMSPPHRRDGPPGRYLGVPADPGRLRSRPRSESGRLRQSPTPRTSCQASRPARASFSVTSRWPAVPPMPGPTARA